MTNTAKYDAFIREHGHALFGVAEFALTLRDALNAVAVAKEEEIPILGGDVYLRRSGGQIVPAYSNWHTDPLPGESPTDFARRSLEETESYLRRYPAPSDAEALFVLVRGGSGA